MQNLSTPSEVLDQLARDKNIDEISKTFIARHVNTSLEILELMGKKQ